MSGYFAALMRSSGLGSSTVASERAVPFERVEAAPAADLAPTGVIEPVPISIDRHTTHEPVVPVESLGPALADKPVASPLQARPVFAADPVPAQAVPLRHVVEPVDAAQPPPPSRPWAKAATAPPALGMPRPVPAAMAPTDALPKGLDLMHAARRWVAADPALLAPATVSEMPADTEPTLVVVQERSVELTVAMKPRPAETAHRSGTAPSLPALQRSTEAPALPIASAPVAHAVVEPAPRWPQPPSPRANDTVQVSIGTIYVKVDAPAPPLSLQFPAPTPRPAPERITARPALARRSLRRL